MKYLFSILTIVFAANAYGVDDYVFKCDQNGVMIESIVGMKQAPEHPVVGLNIKVLKQQVPLYVIQAKFGEATKNLFVTDWAKPDMLSEEGTDLLSLLNLFYGYKTDDLESIRAGLPTDLLETFAYLELKQKDGTVTKLAFEGITPTECQ